MNAVSDRVTPLLSVDRLRLTFSTGPANTVTALDGISLDVAKGEFVVLVGSNGAGKSTLLNAIAGVHRPDSGTIRLDGTDIGHLPDHRRARRHRGESDDPREPGAG